MTQAAYSFTWAVASTGNTALKVGPGALVSVQVNSTGTVGSVRILYDATSSSTTAGNLAIAAIGTEQRGTYWYNVNLAAGLFVGSTTSTDNTTIVWA